MSAVPSIRRRGADHPIHAADRRLAEVRRQSLAALLIVACAPFAGSLVAIAYLLVRP